MTDTTPSRPAPRRHDQEHPREVRPRRWFDDDRGSATAEYAVVILAAVAFAGVLVAVMRSGEVQQILTDLVRGALVP